MKPRDMDNGSLLSRREVVAFLGATGTAWLASGLILARGAAAATTPRCVVRPEQTEGPYFVDERLERSDIRSDPANGVARPGVPLALTFAVTRLGTKACVPLVGARVDVWHCDALGVYSDVDDPGSDTRGQKFLRGHQVTDERGEARFTTIYPGWYGGRAVHIHFKIRSAQDARPGFDLTSQLYFDESLTDRVQDREPYSGRGRRTTRNADDFIFRRGGDQLLLAPVETEDGYAASFAVGLQLD